jgi:putative endonuclease
MASHNDLGKWGEERAVEFLRRAGYEILETNWRFSKAEVDIIAQDGEVLVFVEVKTRSDDFFGRPEVFVSAKKETFLAKAASHYMDKIGHHNEIRFDVISLIKKGKSVEIQHFTDAFFPGLK